MSKRNVFVGTITVPSQLPAGVHKPCGRVHHLRPPSPRSNKGDCAHPGRYLCAFLKVSVCVRACMCVCACLSACVRMCVYLCWFLVRMCVRMCVCVGAAHVCVLPVACFFGHVTRFVAAPKRNEMKNCAAARYARPVTIVCGPSLLCFIKCKSASVI